ncbi:Wzz/FepE/Etk N-terminal domain-containing protein [Pseudoalteromonas sp. CnMc7-15]|uniref:Wzz/FepE/Etk N-terminal domain-containing protein n=1 Tax=unclassified Pseudoalteromonas TaxID=194690 RepID=UPI001EF4DB7D|nr:Wzz/FepE/Etk N-terminal domain-containing protein [Pseudoalteromonas sp. CnMc7-15]MCG7566505.1 Wzz/FepE/Etk N-terminal domain-containing protein [Pseudoalteromonas sp. CnMc7-15]
MEANKVNSDEIKLRDLAVILWDHKVFIVLFTAVCSIAAVAYAISKPNVYTAHGLYMPKSEGSTGSLSKLAGQFGGLASLAGVSLGSGSSDKTEVALELIESRAFLQSVIDKYELLPELLAVQGWDREADTLIYDAELYDAQSKKWVREAPPGKGVIPTPWEGYETLKESINVEFDPKKGVVKLSVTYFSPELAAKLLNIIVAELNSFWQQRQITETQKYIDALAEQAQKTQLAELKEVFYELIAEQTKTNLLSKVSDEAMFETVAAAVVPEEKSAPSRALICVVAFIFSGSIASIVALFYGLASRREKIYG